MTNQNTLPAAKTLNYIYKKTKNIFDSWNKLPTKSIHLEKVYNITGLLTGESLYKKKHHWWDYNARGLKWQLSYFQLQGKVKPLMLNKEKKKKDKIWWVVHMGKRERKKWWHITSPMSSIKMTNSDTCVWTLSAVNLKLSITNVYLNLVILNPSLMDIN